MRKIVKGTAEMVCMALVLTGLVVCMCEAENLDKQFVTWGIGFGMIIAGAVVGVLANRGEKNEYPG